MVEVRNRFTKRRTVATAVVPVRLVAPAKDGEPLQDLGRFSSESVSIDDNDDSELVDERVDLNSDATLLLLR